MQTYSQFLHDKTTGIQMTPPGAVGYVYFRPVGIVASYPVERLSTDERIEMAKKLGVEAIATAAVRVNSDSINHDYAAPPRSIDCQDFKK